MRGLAAALGIVKGQPFAPNDAARKLLDAAAKTAARMANTLPMNGPKYYEDRQWLNPFPGGNAEFRSDT